MKFCTNFVFGAKRSDEQFGWEFTKTSGVSALYRHFRELAAERSAGSGCTQKNFDRTAHGLSNKVRIVEIGVKLRELFKFESESMSGMSKMAVNFVGGSCNGLASRVG